MKDAPAWERFHQLRRGPEGKRLETRLSEATESHLDSEVRELDGNILDSQTHDQVLGICASAFLPNGRLQRETGHVFLTAEPLVELQPAPPNFDALIGIPENGSVIAVECKGSVSRASDIISGLLEKIDAFQNRIPYLEEALGMSIDRVEYVICVQQIYFDKIAREIERRDESGELEPSNPKILLWTVDLFNQVLQLQTRITTREGIHAQHDVSRLTRILAEGFEVRGPEAVWSTFPSTHPVLQATAFVGWLTKENLRRDQDLKRFTQEELIAFFSSSERLPHYAAPSMGSNLATRFLEYGRTFELVVESDEGGYQLNVEGKQLETILHHFEQELHARWARDKAADRAVVEVVQAYDEKQARLTED